MIEMTEKDSRLIDRLRGASILRVVLGHLGLSWFLLPYSSYVGIFLPVLFFCSGYLFIHLFYKSGTIKSFFIKRLLGILIPFYVIYVFAIAIEAIYVSSLESFNFKHFLRIIIITPTEPETPYPLGQIWYLRVLAFCTIICPLVFILSKQSRHFILIPILIGIALSIIQTKTKIDSYFFFFGHSIFQEIVYGSYFFIGAYFFLLDWRSHPILLVIGTLFMIAIAVLSHQWTNGSYILGDHAYAPNIFYFTLGLIGIFLALLFSPFLEWLCNNLNVFDFLLEYCAKHSYGIYLNHSFFIVFTEHYFGLKSVMNQPVLAATKITIVIVASLVAAYPITYITRIIQRTILQKRSVQT